MIPVYTPLLEGNEKKYVMQALHAGEVSSSGKFVRKFEEAFADWIGVKHAVAVSSGTAALETALHAVGVKDGDEVILPSFTIISCAVAVLRVGATPVLVDVTRDTWCIDPEQVSDAMTEETKAVMPVHMMGNLAPDIYTKKYVFRGVKIVEDACHAHGAEQAWQCLDMEKFKKDISCLEYNTKHTKCGKLGHAAAFSFYANKLITTGEGGMVTTDDPVVAGRARSFRNLYLGVGVNRFKHDSLGANYRMANLQAALGLAQLEQADERIVKKRALWLKYLYRLHEMDIEGLSWPTYAAEGAVPWMAAITTPLHAKDVIAALEERGIEARPLFLGLHEQPALTGKVRCQHGWEVGHLFPKGHIRRCPDFPNTEFLSRHGLYLPSGLDLDTSQIDYICSSLEEILHAMSALQT